MGLATMGQSSVSATAAAERNAGVPGPPLWETSQSVMGLTGVLSDLSVSGTTRSSSPSPSMSKSIGLESLEVGARSVVGSCLSPAGLLWYEGRGGGRKT